MTIVEQATSYKIIRLLKNKSDAFHHFTIIKKMMETKQYRSLKHLMSDQGGEFLNSHFKQLTEECRFLHAFSPAHTPEHNGFAERANQKILKKARCMLNASKLQNSYWAKEVSTGTLLSNYTPTMSIHNHSPYMLWTKLSLRVKKLQVFGCQFFVMTPKENQEWKLCASGAKGILLGYENNSSYQILQLSDKKLVVSRHIQFNESIFPELKQQDGDLSPLNVTWDEIEGQEVVDEFHAPLECSLELDNQEPVDEVQMSSIQGTRPTSELELVDEVWMSSIQGTRPTSEQELVDEVLPADEIASLPPICDQVLPPVFIKVIGPRHPALFCSDINQPNILPYTRQAGALLTSVDETPKNFKAAISCNAKEVWMAAINK
ncbi:hypothetical protein O181_072285 [Austropuccinia psidii MF-1]|uniref:Integrase catalytic domain-containing protein n=1 Tax=Austropuccinia psidii MF-1 TaxID=1389203 RepID=A0A9Q3IAW1_9BASI|nr:hypothetical protein [Austropuccinia psidii MF-1]